MNERKIIDAAIEIVERDGVDGLTMPALARHLGVTAMSTYRHFRNKDELVIAMADRALEEVYAGLPTVGDGPWEEELVRLIMELYRALQRAPLYVRLCRSDPKLLLPRPAGVPVRTQRIEAELKVLQPLGLRSPEAVRLLSVLSSYTLGVVMMQVGRERKSNGLTAEEAIERSVADLDPLQYPALTGVKDVGSVGGVADEAFEAGLRLLVAGIKARRSSA